MIHIGLDLHQRNSYVKALTDEGEVIEGRRIDHHDLEALWQYLGQFGSEEKRVVFEATANARWLERLLKEDPTVMRLQVDQWLSLLDDYDQKIDAIERKLYHDYARRDRWRKDVEILMTMPG
jgi:hypothetical protein